MKAVKDYFNNFYKEIKKYNQGIHTLNNGITEEIIKDFESKYDLCLPFYYREWLKINNGGELFAIPAGTELARIQGNEGYKMVYYMQKTILIPKKDGPKCPIICLSLQI